MNDANTNLLDNVNGNTPLHAVLNFIQEPKKAMEIVQILMKKGANPNIKNKKGESALESAKRLEAPQELIDLLTNPIK